MEKISNTFPIKRYKDLKIQPRTFYGPVKKKEGGMIFFGGLDLEEIDSEKTGLKVKKSIDNFVLDFPIKKLSEKEKINTIFYIIETYLIKTEETDPGYKTLGPGQRTLGHKPAKQKTINYFNTRKKEKDLKKEKIIAQTLEYSKAPLEKRFTMRDLEKLSRKVAKSIPREVESSNTVFATLGESHYIKKTMFPDGPKLKK